MYANDDGTGTDLTANLTITPTYGTADVAYEAENTGATDGYITLLYAKGKGIYTPDAVDFIAEDATSIALVGPSQLTVDMKYQDDPTVNESIATVLLQQTKDAKINPENATFNANRASYLLNSFINFEPGDRVNIKEFVTNTSDDYFIQGLEGVIKPGGLINFTWYIRNAGYDTYTFGDWDLVDWEEDTALWAF
jgi:hypothetical protein